jgi:hypothetical protein
VALGAKTGRRPPPLTKTAFLWAMACASLSRKFAVRNQNFGYDYADYCSLNQTGMSNDQVLSAKRPAIPLKEHLTDGLFGRKWSSTTCAKEIIAKLRAGATCCQPGVPFDVL